MLAAAGEHVLLVVFGAALGVIGCFQFSRGVGAVPAAALGLAAAVLAACWLAGLGMGSAFGGLAVAMGWLLASLVLTLPTPGGSVIVTNTTAGLVYLYGGAVCAAAGTVLSMRGRRAGPARPGRRRGGPGPGIDGAA